MATFDPRTGQVIQPITRPGLPSGVQITGQQPGPLPAAAPQGFGPQVPPTGLIGSEQALQGGLAGALQGLQQGIGQGRVGALGQINAGAGGLQPFIGTGQGADQRQAALSGALGPEAQAAAFQAFMDSPGQDFLRERGERAVVGNASALGGLGGGRVMQELQRQGIGFAAQDFGNQFNRLGQVANRGAGAAGQAAGLRGQAAGLLGNLGLQGGLQASQLARGTGQDLAFGRTRAGEQIAGSIGAGSSALSNLINQQGLGAADLLGSTGGNLAGLLAGAGQEQGASQQQLAALLSQLSLQGSGQVAGLPGVPGVQQQGGILGDLGRFASGVGTGFAAFNPS